MKSDTKPQQQIGQLHRKTFHSVFFIPLPQVSIPKIYSIDDDHNFMRRLASLKSAPS